LISQLSPEELEHLASQISGDMQHPGEQADGMHEGGEDEVAGLAHAIQQHLAQNPEAGLEGAAPEKMAALQFVKSASYIEGFIKQALDRGVGISQAVDLYDNALSRTITQLNKQSATIEQEAVSALGKTIKGGFGRVKNFAKKNPLSAGTAAAGVGAAGAAAGYGTAKLTEDKDKNKYAELKGGQHKLDVNHNGKIDAADLKMLRNKGKKAIEPSAKEAAYYEGVLERAREYGFSDSEAIEIVKQSMLNR
jgi:hypothetical protein